MSLLQNAKARFCFCSWLFLTLKRQAMWRLVRAMHVVFKVPSAGSSCSTGQGFIYYQVRCHQVTLPACLSLSPYLLSLFLINQLAWPNKQSQGTPFYNTIPIPSGCQTAYCAFLPIICLDWKGPSWVFLQRMRGGVPFPDYSR